MLRHTLMTAGLVLAALNLTACETLSRDIDPEYMAITALLETDVSEGRRGGFAVSIVDQDGVLYEDTVGMADPYKGIPFRTDTDVRIASMTKPIVSVGIMHLVDKGKISLDDPVWKYIPAFKDQGVATNYDKNEDGTYSVRPPSRDITIRDLLSHTTGIGYPFFNRNDLDRDYIEANVFNTEGTLAERIDILAKLPLYEDPGTKWRYSYAVDVQGRIAEIVSGRSLQDFLDEAIFTPLGMNETRFFMSEADFEDLAVVNGFDEAGNMIRYSDVTLGANPNDVPFGVMSGGAGLLSTMEDYQRFCQMLLSGGSLNGNQILKPETVELMMTPVTKPEMFEPPWPGSSFGLGGFVITDAAKSPEPDADGDWGWAGYWDTHFIVSPKRNMAVILMAQTQPGPTVPQTKTWQKVKAIAYGETYSEEETSEP